MSVYENLSLENLDGEEWKKIDEYEDYQVSNFGRVKSLKFGKEKIRKLCQDKDDYFAIILYGKEDKIYRINILVYETFYSDKLKYDECVHHKDENKQNNYYKNLEKVSKFNHLSFHNKGKIISEETKIKISKNQKINGKHKGENNPKVKLKDGEVYLIKKILSSDYYKSKKITQKFIGKMFRVSRQTISLIKNNKIWNHIIYEVDK